MPLPRIIQYDITIEIQEMEKYEVETNLWDSNDLLKECALSSQFTSFGNLQYLSGILVQALFTAVAKHTVAARQYLNIIELIPR